MFSVADVLAGSRGRLLRGTRKAELRGIAIDSRTTKPGELFVAFRGERVDGHEYVADALRHGAAGALVEHDVPASRGAADCAIVQVADCGAALESVARYWLRRHNVTVVGVTGSVGKTTTKEIIAGLIGQYWPTLRSQGNYNTEIGLPINLMQIEDHHRVAVLEMGMHDIGDIRRLAAIAEPRIAVVTNVHPTHLERLGTIERIAQAKQEIVEALPADGLAVLNADDERVSAMRAAAVGDVLTYGISTNADVRAGEVSSQGLEGTTFTVHYGPHVERARLRMPGTHFIYAALAAVTVATRLGIPFESAIHRLGNVSISVDGRLRPLPGIRGTTLLDDAYNASPASTIAALDLLSEMRCRRVAVLGDMLELGSFEAEGHQLVGRRAASAADSLITVGPRAEEIARAAQRAGLPSSAITSLGRVEDALTFVEGTLRQGDCVLIKGSHGVHLEQLVDHLRANRDQIG